MVQARLWQSGAYQVPVLRGRIGTPLEISELKEHIPGFRWYEDDSDQALKLPVLESTRFAVSPAMSPEIRDVQCHDASNATYAWSRVTGDITRNGQAAFNLDPFSGLASGTPSLDLSAEGRGRLQINCGVALGGQLYDKVLPVAKLTVDVVDNTCWVPTTISPDGSAGRTCLQRALALPSAARGQTVQRSKLGTASAGLSSVTARRSLSLGRCWCARRTAPRRTRS